MKDILKVSKLYLQKYKVIVFLFWAIMLAITLANGETLKSSSKDDFANYEYNKQNNITLFKRHIVFPAEEQLKHSEKIQIFSNKFNEVLTDEKLKELKNDYISSHHIMNLLSGTVYFNPDMDLYKNKGPFIDYYNYFNEEQMSKSDQYRKKIIELKTELDKIESKTINNSNPIDKVDLTKFNKLNNEVAQVFPSYLDNIVYTEGKLNSFLKYNIAEDTNFDIKYSLHNINYSVFYYIVTLIFSALFFALEYHSNFGKFIATLPFKKRDIYFGKIIAALIAFIGVCLIISLSNLWTVKTSIFGDVVSSWNAFSAFYKVYLILLFFILLGAIFSAFCGSMVSVIALYLPALLFAGYPYLLLKKTYDVEIFGGNFNPNDELELLLFSPNASPLLVPSNFIVNYKDINYFYYFIAILIILVGVCSFVYKKHNIDLEGYFFTNKVAHYICLVIAIISFATIPAIFLITLGVNNIISLIIGYLLVVPLFMLLFKTKLRM